MKTQSILQKLTNSGSALLLAGLFCAGVSSVHAAVIITSITAEINSASVLDTDLNGTGDIVNSGTQSTFVGRFGTLSNYQVVYEFQMTGFSLGSQIAAADFSKNFAGIIGFGFEGSFDIDVHAIRTAATSGLLASDYETSAGLLMTDFDGGAPGTAGVKSLSTLGQDNLVTYLQDNWVENEYVFLGLKSNPGTVTGSGIYDFDKTTSATLTLTSVPEPSSAMLIGLGAFAMIARRRRSRA